MIKKYKDHGTLGRLPGSGWHFKITPEVLAMIKERMQTDDKTTATQLVKMNAAGTCPRVRLFEHGGFLAGPFTAADTAR